MRKLFHFHFNFSDEHAPESNLISKITYKQKLNNVYTLQSPSQNMNGEGEGGGNVKMSLLGAEIERR